MSGTDSSFLERILGSGPVVIFRRTKSPEGEVATFVTPNSASIIGYAPADIVGVRNFWTDHVHPEDRAGFVAQTRRALAEKQTVLEREYRFLHADGTYRWLRAIVWVEPTSAAAGELTGYAVDITERRATEEASPRSDQFLSAIVENLPNMIFVKDAKELRFVRFNRAGEKLLGFPREDLMGKNDYDFFPKEDAEFFTAKDREALENGVPVDIPQEPIETKNGRRVLHTKKVPLMGPDGTPEYLLGISEDITDRTLIEEESEHLNATMRLLLDSTDEGIYGIDTSHRCIFVNRAALDMLGHNAEDVMGKNIHQLVHHTREDCTPYPIEECPINKCFHTGNQVRVDSEVFWTRDRQMFPVEYSSHALMDNGEITGAVIAFQDITERKRAERELDRIFSFSPDLLCVANFDGYFLRLNPEWTRVLGYELEDLTASPFIEFVHPDDVEPTLNEMTTLMTGGKTLSFENRYRCKDGTYKWLLWKALPVPDEGMIYAAARDITERRRAEDELARSNAELEQFSYVASHDLQEPLRMIASYVQLLANRYRGKLDADADEFIGYAVDGATRMQALIHDLLAYSRVGKQRRSESVDTNDIVARVKSNLAASTAESNATINSQDLPVVFGDPHELTQLFQNLIANALKFRGNDPPLVDISAEQQEDMWKFAIRDNGIGIDPGYSERIFVMFQRLHTRGEYPGTGIGLAICHKIVERNGGTIWVESDQDKGSTFFFTLPARSDDASDG
ncbi:MAG: PAS domain S-box protein [Actinomycetota bacterium]